MVATEGGPPSPFRNTRLVYLVASLTVILIIQQLYFVYLNRKNANWRISYVHHHGVNAEEHVKIDSDVGKRCTIGIITAHWSEQRLAHAQHLCQKILSNRMNYHTKNQIIDCFIFDAFDGRSLSVSSLSSLVQQGDVEVSLRSTISSKSGAKMKRSNSRHGFEGIGSVANVISHIQLARHFLTTMEATEGVDRDSSCFIMLEVSVQSV